jgi:hypothetical protein
MRRAKILMWARQAAGVAALDGPWRLQARDQRATRTGGPDDDDDDEAALLRKLMPILAAVIAVAVMFS